MYPAPISQYHRPSSPKEAVRLYKRAAGNRMYLAGGMSLMQAIKSRFVQADCLIDLNDIEELRKITSDGNTLCLGAMMRYCDVAKEGERLGAYRAFSDAASHVGDRQVRHRGTVGGSLCWNYIAACTPVAALATGVELDILRARGLRSRTRIAIDDFLGSPMETALEPGDLLVAIRLPEIKGKAGSAYKKWGIVKDALPVVGAGVMLRLADDGTCTQARIAIGGLANGSQRATGAEAVLKGQKLDDNNAIREAARIAAEEVPVQDDPWVSSSYRQSLVARLTTEVAQTALARAQEN